jgi:hypothetical protein
MTRHLVYGLVVQSDRSLFAGKADPGDARPDIVVRHADEEVASGPPGDGRLLLDYRHDDDVHYYCEARPDGGYRLVFVDACEFDISGDLRDVVVRRHRGAVVGIEDVLSSGALLAWQLYMRGVLVLHASAVQVGGRAVAFTGASGRGKTTMATIMCAAGTPIVTDDLLRVDLTDGSPRVRLGSSELRLRKGADELAADFDPDSAPDRRLSADERQVLRPPAEATDRLPLSAIFVPVPGEADAPIRIERLSAVDALFGILRVPRLYGWVDEGVTRRQFEQTAALVQEVPLFVLHVPWGPPFSSEIVPRIVAELDAPSSRPAPSSPRVPS